MCSDVTPKLVAVWVPAKSEFVLLRCTKDRAFLRLPELLTDPVKSTRLVCFSDVITLVCIVLFYSSELMIWCVSPQAGITPQYESPWNATKGIGTKAIKEE